MVGKTQLSRTSVVLSVLRFSTVAVPFLFLFFVTTHCWFGCFLRFFAACQIMYEFERSVLSKEQLAQKTGKDMGDDVMGATGGERFSFFLGVGGGGGVALCYGRGYTHFFFFLRRMVERALFCSLGVVSSPDSGEKKRATQWTIRFLKRYTTKSYRPPLLPPKNPDDSGF